MGRGFHRLLSVTVVCGGFLGVASVASAAVLTPVPGSPFATGSGSRPGWVSFSPGGGVVAAADAGTSRVSMFSVNSSTGALTQVSGSPFATGGVGVPYGLAFSPSGSFLATADNGGGVSGGNASVFAVNSSTGGLSAVAGSPFPAGNAPYSVAFSSSGGLVAVSNFVDSTVTIYRINSTTGALTPVNTFPTGTNPCDVVFSPNGGLLATANFGQNTISMFSVNSATGALTQVLGSPLSTGGASQPCAVAFSPNGGLLASANQATASVSEFAVNPASGAVSRVAGSPFTTPIGARDVTYSPNGQLLAVANGARNGVSVFNVDAATGKLSLAAGSPFTSGNGSDPPSVSFSPNGRFLAVGNDQGNSVSVFSVNAGSSSAPTIGKTVNVGVVSGQVLVKAPGQSFVALTATAQVPTGSQIDARRGSLKLTSAAAGGRRSKTQSVTLSGAVFKTSQAAKGKTKGLTTLALVEGGFTGAPSYASCRRHGGLERGAPSASVAASGRVLQTLRARGRGSFSTRGHNASATSRGTAWTISDRCDGTLITVQKDTVVIRDFVRHKTITLHAGQRYLAKR